MTDKNLKSIFNIALFIFSISAIVSCASMGTPSGGPIDYAPPVFKKSNPAPNQTGVTQKKITLEFDEVLRVDNPSENVIISPTQKEMPRIKANLRTINIELIDSLIPNTSYTIDFGSAIKDNNEGNVLEGFSLAFSTGDIIDSLQISGTVLNASNLEPITGITVGLHPADNDTAFKTLPFLRVSRTNEYGKFTIKNVKEGSYRLYAIKDADKNYMFNSPSEDIAFYSDIITPSTEWISHIDTVFSDSTRTKIDTICNHSFTKFTPDSIILFAFNEGIKLQYLSKYERKAGKRLHIDMATKSNEIATLTPLNFTPENNDWFVLERNSRNDSLIYWIKDSTIYKTDTLSFLVDYLKSDTLFNLIPTTDTLVFIDRTVIKEEKSSGRRGRRSKIDTIRVEELEISNGFPPSIDIYTSPSIKFATPIESVDKSKTALLVKKDSIWEDIPTYEFIGDSLSPRTFYLKYKWDFNKQYKFIVDSAGITDIYGVTNDSIVYLFKSKKSSDYSNLYVETLGLQDGAFAELLNNSDKPVRYATIKNGGAEFAYVKPGKYFVRVVIDKDNNKLFTPGSFDKKQQPETVYYYPKAIELKPNWDVEQTWDVFGTPVTKQKPAELIKNIPKKDKKSLNEKSNNDDPIYSNRPTTSLKF